MIEDILDALLLSEAASSNVSSDVVEARPNGQHASTTVPMTVGAMRMCWRRQKWDLGMENDDDDEKGEQSQ